MNDIETQETIITIPIGREKLQQYMFTVWALRLLLVSIVTYGLGLIFLLFYLVWFGRWWTAKWVAALSYRLEGSVLQAECGVFFRKFKAIPLGVVVSR